MKVFTSIIEIKGAILMLMAILWFFTSCDNQEASNSIVSYSIEDSLHAEKILSHVWSIRGGDPDSALFLAKEVMIFSQEKEFAFGEAKAHRYQGIIHGYQDRWDSTEFYYRKSLEIVQRENQVDGLISILDKFGTLEKKQGHLFKADSFYREGIYFAEKTGDSVALARAFNNLGTVFQKANNFDDALFYYRKGLEIREEINDVDRVILSYENIATVYGELNQFEEAEQTFRECLRGSLDSNDLRTASRAFFNLGLLFYETDQLDSAEQYLHESMRLREQLGSYVQTIPPLLALGDVFTEQDRLEEAYKSYETALIMARKENKESSVLAGLNGLGSVLLKMEKPNKALGYLEKALDYGSELGNEEGLENTYFYLIKVYNQLNMKDRLDWAFDQHDSISKENATAEMAGAIVPMSDIHSYYAQQEKEQKLKRKNELTEATSQKYALGVLTLVILLLGSFISFLLYRKNQRSKLSLQQQALEKQTQAHELDMTRSMIRGQDKERKRVATELHDSVGSLLATVKMQYEDIAQTVEGLRSEQAEKMDNLQQLISDAVEEVRRISHNMVSGLLTQFGLVPALKSLAETLESTGKLKVTLTLAGVEDRLDSELEIQVYRMVQELATNCIRHARANHFHIRLIKGQENLKVITKDDGQGMDLKKIKPGLGLKNIKNRVELLEGTLERQSTLGEGFENNNNSAIESPSIMAPLKILEYKSLVEVVPFYTLGQMIRLAVVDDHQIFRDGLKALLKGYPEFRLVGEAANSGQLYSLLAAQTVDVILLDIQLSGKGGLEIAQDLTVEYPDLKILILSMHREEAFIKAALGAGASGYVLKDAGKETLMEAIRDVSQGKKYLSKGVTEVLVESLLNPAKETSKEETKHLELSQRELEVLQLICQEFTTPQIADKLHISAHTVKSHRKNLLSKLNVSNVAGLVKFAVENDLF